MKIIVDNKTVQLNQADYKGSGGEGTVYCKGSVGYKIYHDPAKMIHPKKIHELQELMNIANILGPQDIIKDYKKNKPIGFTMPFIKNTEFLCKIFTRSFKERNNVSPEIVMKLVKQMQETLSQIHKKNILVVDYNEMNFLMDLNLPIPFHIDVDSYQTPSFKATALMESVRDRISPKNQFSELTDWFSWACVTFQMYVGVHPFKGRRSDYSPKEISRFKMMDDNVSVFDKGVTLPRNCYDLSVIPKAHLKWYKQVFKNKDRSVPPMPDEVVISIIKKPTLIGSTNKFETTQVWNTGSKIENYYTFDNSTYFVHPKSIQKAALPTTIFKVVSRAEKIKMCSNGNNGYITAVFEKHKKTITFREDNNRMAGIISADNWMQHNGIIYSVLDGRLTENTFSLKLGRIMHRPNNICNVFNPAYKLFDGVCIQDILRERWMAIPFKPEACVNIHTPEIKGYRILDAKYDSKGGSHICVVMGEKKGKYTRFVFCFNNEHTEYDIRIDEDVEQDVINFVMKDNGLCVMIINDEKVEAFYNNNKVKIIKDPPFDSSMKLYTEGNNILFANGDNT